MSAKLKMVKIKIRKDNLSGRTEDMLELMSGEKVKVTDNDWTEIDDTDFKLSCINPTLYEVEGEDEKPVDKPKEPRKKSK